MTVTEQLRKAIRGSGQGLREISRGAGIDVSALSRFMTGERGLKLESADKLCAYFGLELREKKKGR